jgi:predicted CXXCH cytochrome family protein
VAAPAYVGAARCEACHAAVTAAWRGSDHERAMQPASEASLLGDFGGARFEHDGRITTFTRRDGRFVVRTEDAAGAETDYEVAYAFGVRPLQQLLLPLPGGRLQALGVAWDARAREAGGQRWFALHPEERIPPGDVLHWTQPSQNWNSQCAECHSTNLRKGYDPAKDAFTTTWTDVNVACEACHGPGSLHVAWAETTRSGDMGLAPRLAPARPEDWRFADGAPIAARVAPRTEHAELEACAPCHARRSTLREGRRPEEPLLDTHRPVLLEPGLYEADGQMRDEVYVYGSFLQSRMHAAGVTCSDCHDPHTARLRAEGNALCAQCHRPERFDAPAHHHHEAGSDAAQCVACHMPARSYMVVDPRHDHSFRVPRPDLSAAIGTPNACSDCHAKWPAQRAADAVARWFPDGRHRRPHYGLALDAGRRQQPGADAALAAVVSDPAQPAIVRASALALLQPRSEAARTALRAGLGDPDPLVRLGALEAVPGLGPAVRKVWVAPLLRDPVRAVRIEAGRALADLPAELWLGESRDPLAAALSEYRAAQAVHAERPEAHVSLGSLAATFGDLDEARREYETALRLGPWFVPAYVNLADVERASGREAEAEALLRRALALAPDVSEIHYALALTLVRVGRHAEALPELERAAALAPDSPDTAYTLALLLDELGDDARAREVVAGVLARWPEHPGALALRDALGAAQR